MYPTEVIVNEKNIAKLQEFYQVAYREIFAEIEGASSFGVYNRRAILQQIEEILQELGGEVNQVIHDELQTIYVTGIEDADKQLQHVGADSSTAVEFQKIHKDAVVALIDDTQKAFGESMQGVNRSAQQLLGKAVREQLTQKLATGTVSGAALREIKQNVVGVLHTEGLSSLIDKGGNHWSLDRYGEMLIRTKAVEARNRGLVNRMAQNDYDLVQVSKHGADDVCGKWEGLILSITGKTAGYPTVAQAEDAGLFHPNCKHAINALVPSLARLTHAYDPDLHTLTQSELDKATAS